MKLTDRLYILTLVIVAASFPYLLGTVAIGPAGGTVPVGGIILYEDGVTCPTGYAEATNFRGRAIVGMPSAGTIQSVGTAYSNGESRLLEVNAAGGLISTGANSGGNPNSGGNQCATSGSCAVYNMTSSSLFSNSTIETAVPYRQAVICKKS